MRYTKPGRLAVNRTLFGLLAWTALCHHALPAVAAPAKDAAKAAYTIEVPEGWVKAGKVPQGMDVGYRRALPQDGEAMFCFHHELMPVEASGGPTDVAGIERQIDTLVRSVHPKARRVTVPEPNVGGKIMFNAAYETAEGGAELRRRYTYFIASRTAFVVQCIAPSAQWNDVSSEFDAILLSLKPGVEAAKTAVVADPAAVAAVKVKTATLVTTFPQPWSCTVTNVAISGRPPKGKRTLEISAAFDHKDIGEIYALAKQLFSLASQGKGEAELAGLPDAQKRLAPQIGPFLKYVGQLYGVSFGDVAACRPPIERFRVSILDSSRKRMGAIGISREDLTAILTGKVTANEPQRVARMYTFD